MAKRGRPKNWEKEAEKMAQKRIKEGLLKPDNKESYIRGFLRKPSTN